MWKLCRTSSQIQIVNALTYLSVILCTLLSKWKLTIASFLNSHKFSKLKSFKSCFDFKVQCLAQLQNVLLSREKLLSLTQSQPEKISDSIYRMIQKQCLILSSLSFKSKLNLPYILISSKKNCHNFEVF